MDLEKKFYYLPSFIGWVNVNHIVAISIADNIIYLDNGKQIKNVPVSELKILMELEQGKYCERIN